MNNFSSTSRLCNLEKLTSARYDLLVIGGGITGAGIALDARSRGINTALIEMQDFAAGTSSRSTKLIHGGLRYLKQFEFRLVAEVGKERAIVYENGRHVTRPEVMLLPLVENGSIGYLGAWFGLFLYDLLAGVHKPERRCMLSAAEIQQLEPALNQAAITGGAKYYEYRTDDARLTIEVMKEAADRGAVALNYVRAISFLYEQEKICGVEAKDMLTGRTFKIYADQVVNATGPWVDSLDVLNDPSKGEKLFLTKGVHVVVDRKRLPLKHSVYFDTADKRMVFAIPRGNKVYAGTTDTAYTGNLENPGIGREDRVYIVDALNKMFPEANLDLSHLESAWAGLRPLIREKGKSPSAVSRKEEIFQYDSGLITIAGGKLTGYRKMAERIVDLVAKRLTKIRHKTFNQGTTTHVKISGGHFVNEEEYQNAILRYTATGEGLGLSREESSAIAATYGSNTEKLFDTISAISQEKSGLPLYLRVLIHYSIEAESVVTLSDFFIRRTGAMYFNIAWVKQWKAEAAMYMAQVLSWTDDEKAQNINALEDQLRIVSE